MGLPKNGQMGQTVHRHGRDLDVQDGDVGVDAAGVFGRELLDVARRIRKIDGDEQMAGFEHRAVPSANGDPSPAARETAVLRGAGGREDARESPPRPRQCDSTAWTWVARDMRREGYDFPANPGAH